MQKNFRLISDSDGKIKYPGNFRETIYPGIQPPIPHFYFAAAKHLLYAKVDKGIEALDQMRVDGLERLLKKGYKKEAARLCQRYTEP